MLIAYIEAHICIFRRTNVFNRWQITQSSRANSSKVNSSNHLICKSAKIFHKNDMQYVALFRTALNNGLVEGYLIDPSKPWCNPFAISEPSFTKKVECLFSSMYYSLQPTNRKSKKIKSISTVVITNKCSLRCVKGKI